MWREICCLIYTTIKILSTKNKSDGLTRHDTTNITVSPCLTNNIARNTTRDCHPFEDRKDNKPWKSKSHEFMLASNLVLQNASVSHSQILMRCDEEDDMQTLRDCFGENFGCGTNDKNQD